jgi:hypothetical protein
MNAIHTFDINEVKCSETGPNYAPQVYVDGTDGDRAIQLWFATRPGISHEKVHGLIKHMHELLASCHVEVSANPYPRTKSVGR